MTATPHAGREEDFQLFIALLDTDRFEGRYRDAVHTVNTDGLMRRMIKEDLKTFEGGPLCPNCARHGSPTSCPRREGSSYATFGVEARITDDLAPAGFREILRGTQHFWIAKASKAA